MNTLSNLPVSSTPLHDGVMHGPYLPEGTTNRYQLSSYDSIHASDYGLLDNDSLHQLGGHARAVETALESGGITAESAEVLKSTIDASANVLVAEGIKKLRAMKPEDDPIR